MLRLSPTAKRCLIAGVLLLGLLVFFRERLKGMASLERIPDFHISFRQHDGPPTREQKLKEIRAWQKKEDIKKIVGFVFYGRRAQASILDCYLRRNLKSNGGILDEVLWLQRTDDVYDRALLNEMINSEPLYAKTTPDDKDGYASAYDDVQDDVLYVKIDTDIVFIEDTTIISMVHLRATRPDFFVVGANVINQPLSSWVHWSLGAVRPYLPENATTWKQELSSQESTDGRKPVDWRASLLPAWSGADDFDIEKWEPPEGRKHRWLPVTDRRDHVLDKTPIVETQYDAYSGPGWWKWTIGAQAHYSLFENLERGEMWRYRFGLWDYRDLRMGLQFVALTGRDINLAKPIDKDDEGHLCATMPKRLGRSAVADGGGVAVHFSFDSQSAGMAKTDILERYRAYAQEKICKGRMLWTSPADDERLMRGMPLPAG